MFFYKKQVQQPFDPSSYYPHFYRSAPDNDGRVSPFHPPGAPPKYNGNVAVLSSQEVCIIDFIKYFIYFRFYKGQIDMLL